VTGTLNKGGGFYFHTALLVGADITHRGIQCIADAHDKHVSHGCVFDENKSSGVAQRRIVGDFDRREDSVLLLLSRKCTKLNRCRHDQGCGQPIGEVVKKCSSALLRVLFSHHGSLFVLRWLSDSKSVSENMSNA